MARGLRLHGSRGLRPGHRRHGLQRPVDVEGVHGDGGHAGSRGRSPRPRRADHGLPARVQRQQCLRGATRAEDHAPDAPEPHRRLYPRGACRQQHRAGPRRLRVPRSQHLRYLAPLPRRQRLRLLEPGDRPGGLHPGASRGQAVRAGHARLPARAGGHGPQHLRSDERSGRPTIGRWGTCLPIPSRRSTCR